MNRKLKDNDVIKLPHGNVKALAESLGVSETTVRCACKGVRTMSDMTFSNIRNTAVDCYGGKILINA